MKLTQKRFIAQLLGLFFIFLLTASCQREVNIDLDKGFSSQIQQIIPQSIIDSLRSKGMIINEGLVPPQLEGIYVASPFSLQTPYGPEDGYKIGKVIPDQYYKFYGQTAANAITYDYRQADGNDKGNGKGAFIGGNGNKFTIFSENIGVGSTIPYKQVTVVTGELTEQGIQNFQYAFVVKEKTGDDDNKVLIAVGKSRIWKDGNGLAVKTTYFPQSVQPKSGSESARNAAATVSEVQTPNAAQ